MLSRSSHSHWVLWSEALGYRRLASSSSHGRVTSYHATTSGTLQYWSRTRAVLILFSVVLYNISTVSHSFILSKHFILVLVWVAVNLESIQDTERDHGTPVHRSASCPHIHTLIHTWHNLSLRIHPLLCVCGGGGVKNPQRTWRKPTGRICKTLHWQ